jgi:hypothetical protein
MRHCLILFAAFLLFSCADLAYGAESDTAPGATATRVGAPTAEPLRLAQRQFQGGSPHHCCNRKGAIIGAAVGAGLA